MRGTFKLGTLPANLRLNPAAARINGVGGFRATRILPFASSEQLIAEQTPAFGIGADAPSLQPDLYAGATMLPATVQPGALVRDEMKFGKFNNVPFTIGQVSTRVLLKPASGARRVYLFVINTNGANTLFIAFGQDATALIGVPIPVNNGSFEWNNVVPQDDVFLVASGAGTTGVLLYANDNLNGTPS